PLSTFSLFLSLVWTRRNHSSMASHNHAGSTFCVHIPQQFSTRRALSLQNESEEIFGGSSERDTSITPIRIFETLLNLYGLNLRDISENWRKYRVRFLGSLIHRLL